MIELFFIILTIIIILIGLISLFLQNKLNWKLRSNIERSLLTVSILIVGLWPIIGLTGLIGQNITLYLIDVSILTISAFIYTIWKKA